MVFQDHHCFVFSPYLNFFLHFCSIVGHYSNCSLIFLLQPSVSTFCMPLLALPHLFLQCSIECPILPHPEHNSGKFSYIMSMKQFSSLRMTRIFSGSKLVTSTSINTLAKIPFPGSSSFYQSSMANRNTSR